MSFLTVFLDQTRASVQPSLFLIINRLVSIAISLNQSLSIIISLNQSEITIKRNTMISSRGKQTKNYVISFELKLDKTVSGWSNVLRVFNEEHSCCMVGSRIPAVYVHSGSTRLHICNAINNNGNTCFNSKPLPKGQYTTVVIQQVLKYDNRYRYSIEIGGEEVYQVTNINAKVFQNVKLFASDNSQNPSAGSIKNVKWLNIGMRSFYLFIFFF